MTVTVTGTVRDVSGKPDRSKWVFTSVLRESDDDNSIVSPGLVVATPNDVGLLTVELDPGLAIVRYRNTSVTVTVPEADIGLWDLIEAGVAVPPNTGAAALAAAIAAYFEANPGEGGGDGGVPDDGSVSFAKLAGPLVVTSSETIAANNNNTTVPTSAAVQAAITAAITALIGGAPGALDTLKELADAINDDASFAASVTTALGGKQPLDADLTAIAALTSAANKLPYSTGSGAWALADLSVFARTLLDDANAAAALATLGATAATDTPRFLKWSGSAWPDRPADSRMTFFIGGSAATNSPADADLAAGDVWIPATA